MLGHIFTERLVTRQTCDCKWNLVVYSNVMAKYYPDYKHSEERRLRCVEFLCDKPTNHLYEITRYRYEGSRRIMVPRW